VIYIHNQQIAMSNLVAYNTQHEMSEFGLVNTGVICYFNSVMQSMLSCTSFIEAIKHIGATQEVKNPIMMKFVELVGLTEELDILDNRVEELNSDKIKSDKIKSDKIKSDKLEESQKKLTEKYSKIKNATILNQRRAVIINSLRIISPSIWREMVVFLCRKNKTDIRNFLSGQQCAREGFHYLMDSLDAFNGIQNLFIHRYKSMIRCFKCDDWVSKKECVYSLFEVQADLTTPQLDQFKSYDLKLYTEGQTMNEFLQKQPGYVEDFICPKCKDRDAKYKVNYLVMAPEILVVLSKKYVAGRKLDVYTEFPETMEFPGSAGPLKYQAVSQIEHTGGLNGGHYWAISKRRDGWRTLNDTRISDGEFKPTNNTYMVFYHLVA
jgi:ubiquitin C-terminal hydrolase